MITMRDKQNEFIEELSLCDTWVDKFTMLIELGNRQLKEIPKGLEQYRIQNCQSKTFFRALDTGGCIDIRGWSNSSTMAGVILAMRIMFDSYPVHQLEEFSVDFHVKSGLIDNVTPMRKEAILEMINRVNKLKK